MRKGRDGEKKTGGEKNGKKREKSRMKIVATTSLPAVDFSFVPQCYISLYFLSIAEPISAGY